MIALPLIYVRCGRGVRVAHLERSVPKGWRGQVWIDAAHRWSKTILILPGRLFGYLNPRDPVARRAIASVSPGRPRCRHTSHTTGDFSKGESL